jgi:hypothetical protein
VDLKTRLIQIAPRDRSGATASDRFIYQQTWALCHLLLLHESNADYVITFDHHEDVSVLDSEIDPKQISGFQIKTNNGNWTVKALLKREKGQGKDASLLPSILGKLYDLTTKYPDEVKTLQVVSNESVTVRLKPDGKKSWTRDHTKFEELDAKDQQLIVEGLTAELGLTGTPKVDGVIEFAKADIPIKGHETHAKGKIVEFLQTLFPDQQFRITAIYRALLSEVTVRNNNDEPVGTYEDFLRLKSISRSRFDVILQESGVSKKVPAWGEVAQRLGTELAPLPLVQGIRQEWDAALLDKLVKRDPPYLQLRELVATACKKYRTCEKLVDLISFAYQDVVSSLKKEWAFSEMYVKACIAVEVYEH